MTSQRRKRSESQDEAPQAKGDRRLLGMVEGASLYDENGELIEERLIAFGEALNEAIKRRGS